MELKEFKEGFLSENFEVFEKTIETVDYLKNDAILFFLLESIKNTDRKIQARAAGALRRTNDSRIVEQLLEAVRDSENKFYMGTFVYALQAQECKNHFLEILKIALFGTYEAQTHALEILGTQRFNLSKQDILTAKKMIEDYSKLDNKCDDYELLVDELLECVERAESLIDS